MKQAEFPNVFGKNQKSLPLLVTVTHDGFWDADEKGFKYNTDINCDRNSVILAKDCLLTIYKIGLRHLLLSMDVIQPGDIVLPNLIPHIIVRKNKYDPNTIYDSIQKQKVLITQKNILINRDSISLLLDQKTNLTMLLLNDKNLKSSVDLFQALTRVVQLLNSRPELIEQYAKLENFGDNETEYWYQTKELYPNNIVMPKDHVVSDDRKVSSAGTIL